MRVPATQFPDSRRDDEVLDISDGDFAGRCVGARGDCGLACRAQQRLRLRQKRLAGIGEQDALRRAVKQAHAETLFQLTQAATDGSRAQTEFARSAGQAAVLDKEGEEGEIVGHGF